MRRTRFAPVIGDSRQRMTDPGRIADDADRLVAEIDGDKIRRPRKQSQLKSSLVLDQPAGMSIGQLIHRQLVQAALVGIDKRLAESLYRGDQRRIVFALRQGGRRSHQQQQARNKYKFYHILLILNFHYLHPQQRAQLVDLRRKMPDTHSTMMGWTMA